MSLSLDKALGIQPAAVRVRAQRLELLASNLANADTPNYKAQDIDFRSALATQVERDDLLPLEQTRQGHLPLPRADLDSAMAPLYRIPSQPSLDGNTVDPQFERAAFAENAMQFQSSLEFLNRRVSGIRSALRKE
ncbi:MULTISPECIES: flagellar basal body rod protein FlgB [Marichromatium]|uniref:Flagellar basal body rod protein FlgB n=1 Tax=Marichromatium gracile TaxID=1048 RepID=A0A4R4AA50_MARGR|nr:MULTISPECIES: flagellar basal body rod protein FlgB [Marichromatium]MBO8087136.1 flagellar basal body rod protein FlgB [Marichromatium sp.]MBK1708146.1 flagellar basal body rod protein FlgB [Marichromatium gracile]RNE89618.1 flagellar basal body rod protein FlgB [Marichromatium sp. AB31]RNE94697.1 flagellar basal body rod protein FlgB [Marichromatium sp. AB32]TCW35827.1 flagellar basal-body rod protein FlgB [Marichromatium gracile]